MNVQVSVIPRCNSHIKVTGKLVVSLWGVNCRFWSRLGCLGWKVTLFASYSTVHREIYKTCPDSDRVQRKSFLQLAIRAS